MKFEDKVSRVEFYGQDGAPHIWCQWGDAQMFVSRRFMREGFLTPVLFNALPDATPGFKVAPNGRWEIVAYEKRKRCSVIWGNKAEETNWYNRCARIIRDYVIREKYSEEAEELAGCTIAEFRKYIEDQFTDGMTWGEYASGWELDHIEPQSRFKKLYPKNYLACFHFTNYQPLWWQDNMLKSDTFDPKRHQEVTVNF